MEITVFRDETYRFCQRILFLSSSISSSHNKLLLFLAIIFLIASDNNVICQLGELFLEVVLKQTL